MHNSSIFSSPLGLILLLALTIAGAYFGSAPVSAFALLLLLLCACARLWSGGVLEKATLSIDDGQTACHAGDTLTLTLRVFSRSIFPLIWLDVFVPLGESLILRHTDDEKPEPIQLPMQKPLYGFSERFAWLLWQHEIACEETLLSVHRGMTEISAVSLQAGDGLAMSARQKWLTLERPVRLWVYPRLVSVDVSPFARLIADAQTGARGQTEDVTLLRSSRPYQHGDPFKRINWRHLALSGRMETNQYETITPGCITFVLDLQSFMYLKTVVTRYDMRETLPFVHEDALESMLSLIASCIQGLFDRGLRFALIIPGYDKNEGAVLCPGNSETALLACMEALAAVDYRGQKTYLPADELRRLRRELGILHLCAYTDAPTLLEPLSALGLERTRIIACLRQEGHPSAGESPVMLLSDLTGELSVSPAGTPSRDAPDLPGAPSSKEGGAA